MKRVLTAAGLFILAGCTGLTDARTGQVKAFNGNTIVIRGPLASGATTRPPAAMAVMARDLCQDARFVSAEPSGGTGSLYTFSCR